MALDTEKRKKLRALFWGRVATFDRSVRVVSLVFVIVAILAMSFTQLGFWSAGTYDSKQAYVLFLLTPVVMGALLYGRVTGGLLGLFTGLIVFAHAKLLPLDYYEVYFMTPLNTFVLLTFLGVGAGWLFDIALRSNPQGASRYGRIIAICFALSLVVSGLVQINTIIMFSGASSIDAIGEFLLISPLGFAVQALLDAVIMALFCCFIDYIVRIALARMDDRGLLSVFRSWMLIISLIVFMASSAINFSLATINAMNNEKSDMLGEVSYLSRQLNARSDTAIGVFVDGYDASTDGFVYILDENAVVLASDIDSSKVGMSFLDVLGYDASDTDSVIFLNQIIGNGGFFSLEDKSEDGKQTLQIVYCAVSTFNGGYVVLQRSTDMMFANRVEVMASSTALAVVLILAIALVASRLLNQVVVRRIDETNDSLGKITHGDLNERVHVTDSREFTSLSAGINMTVSALRDSIEEAEQRNAQELATAKAIQESSLPTDFPAFPDIDRFDIYASMKTAKEVGGDFYDFFLIDDTSKLGFVIADVSGKGIPASLFMMTAKTQVRTYMESGLPVNKAVDAANHQLCISNDAGMFVTMYACTLDYETGELSYVNAGHNPPLIHSGDTWEWMRDVSGLPLGLYDDVPYELYVRQLEVEDMLYLYTDGVSEAMDIEGNLFGEKRLEDTLYKYSEFNPRSVCVGMRRAITDFTQDCDQSDDITMMGLKYGVPPETNAVMILNGTVDQLVHVCNYINAELHRRRAPKVVYNPLNIAAEELFVNVCHYAYPDATPENPGEVRISFEYEAAPPSLTVQITDDGIPYNPLAKPDAVTPDDIAEVPIGGLGILMAKKSVDEMTYERVGNSNVLTFKKGW